MPHAASVMPFGYVECVSESDLACERRGTHVWGGGTRWKALFIYYKIVPKVQIKIKKHTEHNIQEYNNRCEKPKKLLVVHDSSPHLI